MERQRGLSKKGRIVRHTQENKKYQLRVMDLSAGIGGNTMALNNVGVEYKTVAIANEYYEATYTWMDLYGYTRNLSDMVDINYKVLPKADLIMCKINYSELVNRDRKRINHYKMILEYRKPTYIVIECNTVIEKHEWRSEITEMLKMLGYNIYEKELSAVDFGSPQNVHKWYIIATKKNNFEFPEGTNRDGRVDDIFMKGFYEEEYLLDLKYKKLLKKWKPKENNVLSTYNIKGRIETPSLVNNEKIVYNTDGYCPALFYTTSLIPCFYDKKIKKMRGLNELEWVRLMGLDDEHYYALYKQTQIKKIIKRIVPEETIVPMITEVLKKLLIDEEKKTNE